MSSKHAADNIVVAQELIHSLGRRKGTKGAMIAKNNLEKAYDRIDWGFLEGVLRTIGFEDMLIKVTLSCSKSMNMSVIWNGSRLQVFNPERGLRQGNPLSSYLFVLCMKVLGQRVHTTVQEKQWKPCTMGRNGVKISHLFFTDDLLLFGEASHRQAMKNKGDTGRILQKIRTESY